MCLEDLGLAVALLCLAVALFCLPVAPVAGFVAGLSAQVTIAGCAVALGGGMIALIARPVAAQRGYITRSASLIPLTGVLVTASCGHIAQVTGFAGRLTSRLVGRAGIDLGAAQRPAVHCASHGAVLCQPHLAWPPQYYAVAAPFYHYAKPASRQSADWPWALLLVCSAVQDVQASVR